MASNTRAATWEEILGCEYVKIVCDETNNPSESIAQGYLNIDIYGIPKPIPYIVLKFKAVNSNITFEEVCGLPVANS